MNLDQIEDLIRRYLAAGVAVVVILIAPVTGGAADPPPAAEEAGNGQIDIIENGPPGEDDPPAGATPPTGQDAPSDPAEEGDGAADGAPSGADPAGEEPGTRTPGDQDAGNPSEDGPTPDGADDEAGDEAGAEAGDEAATGTGNGDDTRPGAGATSPETGPGDDDEDQDGTGDDRGDTDGTGAGDTEDDTDSDSGTGDDTGSGTGSGTGDDTGDDADTRDSAGDDVAITDDRAGADPAPEPSATDPDLEARGPADDDEPGLADDPEAADPPAPGTPEPGGAGGDTGSAAGEGDTAAERFGWGTPAQSEDFTTTRLTGWTAYDGPGHAGQGQRSPDAVTVRDGVLTITGDDRGTTGGLCWGGGQENGRWEGRVRAPAGDPSYNPLLLLWPDADDFPVGGEIDFMEMLDPTRRTVDFYLHFGEDNDQIHSEVQIDGTAWHNWAVEWTPEAITGYVDGVEWFRSTDPSTFPPGPMHLCVQLDWFPSGDAEVRESSMEVAWVRQYALDEGATVAPASAGSSVLERMFSWD